MSQLGRISGPLLEANLIRLGVDLTFRNQRSDTDLLYLDVNNNRIGVKTLGTNELDVNDTIHTVDLISTTSADIENIRMSTNIVSTFLGPINITPAQSNPLVLMDHMKVANIDFKDNRITALSTNGSVVLDPIGTGRTEILSSATVNGDLNVTGSFAITGNLSKQGNIIVGNSILDDKVTVNTDFTQDINPGTTLFYDLGKSNKRWRNVYVHDNSNITSLTYNSFTISDQLQVDGPTATIHTLQSNDDVLLNPTTGIVDVERIRITGNTITNLDATALTLSSTGIGYTRFMDNNAMVIPAGTTAEQPLAAQVGQTRWNTEEEYLECFDGTVWNIATGPGNTTVGVTDMEDLSNVWILVLG